MRIHRSVKNLFALLVLALFASGFAVAQYPGADQTRYQIVSARYGSERNNVDVTDRLRELASQGTTFRMGNSTFGIDPDQGVVKTLRIFARASNGQVRRFEYREGSTVDGSLFTGWNRGEWGNGRGKGGWNDGDEGEYRIVHAQYGTPRNNVDVTARLRELARQDMTFRMGNSTFGVDPDPGVVKTLRIFANGPNGQTRTFEYREGSTVDGTMFSAWGGGDWGNERWTRGWGDDRDDDRDGDHDGDRDRDRGNGRRDNVVALTIIRATYGAGDRRGDVTALLQSLVRDGRLDVPVRNYNLGGDPAPNRRKTLSVIYSDGRRGGQQRVDVKEGGRLTIP